MEAKAAAPLRVGLMVDSFTQSQWVRKVVADIQASSVAQIALVVSNDSSEERQGAIRKAWEQRKYLLYKAYNRFDARFFRIEPDAFRRVSIEDLVAGCPTLPVTPIKKKYVDYFRPEDVAAMRAHKLDVVLRFGFRILKGEVLDVARYGVWSYHQGDNLVNRGGPPGFWEVMEGHSVTGTILQVLTDDLDAGKVIYRSYAPTHRRSVKRNKNNYYWKSASFVMRRLQDLYERGPAALEGDPFASVYHPYSHRLYRNPTNRELLPLLFRFGMRTALDKLRETLHLKQWFLAYHVDRNGGGYSNKFYHFKHIIPPKDRYWADPFPVSRDGKYFVFCEEYVYARRKGHISALEIDAEGNYSRPVKVLEKDYHLSYPFIFQWRGEYYMIPETMQNRTVELYRCVSFPLAWELETVLMENVRAVDTTLAEINGLWWMFVNIGAEGATNPNDELFLFYSEAPTGPWQPHRHNPVKSDCRSARPAGRVFRWRGDFYRPSQDCSVRYGYAIAVNKIVDLGPCRFQEVEVARILPQWSESALATHTLNNAGALTVIDGMRLRRRFGPSPN